MGNHTELINKLYHITLRSGLLFVLALLLLGATDTIYASGTIVVNSSSDIKKGNDGLCTLREAIIAANSNERSGNRTTECSAGGNGVDIIMLPLGTYTLTRSDEGKEDSSQTGDLDITGDLEIRVFDPTGTADSPNAIIDASGISDRVFHILSGSVTLVGLTIKNGTAAGNGGGFYNNGSLLLIKSTVTENSAGNNGGGIFNTGTLTFSESTLSANTAAYNGGGLYNNGGSASLKNSTISGNKSGSSGGGLFNHSGSAAFNNVTVTNNTADSNSDDAGDGGGLRRDAGAVTLTNSILAGNADNSAPARQQNDCSGTLQSASYSLIQDTTGCFITTELGGNILGQDPQLDPLADNGGPTLTHALAAGSPAVDAGDGAACLLTDQRGEPRQGAACDIGAFEVQDPVQQGPIFEVNSPADTDDGLCSARDCTLREAIQAANARPNDNSGLAPIDEIRFPIFLSGAGTITLTAALPAITNPVLIDGDSGAVTLDGSGITAADACGLTINSDDSVIQGLVIQNFSSHGLCVAGSDNRLANNTISVNGGDGVHISAGDGNTTSGSIIDTNAAAGVRILSGVGHRLSQNSIFDNGDLGVALVDSGSGSPNNGQKAPVVFSAVPTGTNSLMLRGRVDGPPATDFTLEFFANASCDPSNFGEGQQLLGAPLSVSTAAGSSEVTFDHTVAMPSGPFITAIATDAAGNSSAFSQCVPIGPDNDSWPRALRLTGAASPTGVSADQYLDKLGQSRWYKFSVEPNSRVIVTLTDLPANYDLTLYKDIAVKFDELVAPQDLDDLVQLNAEFAGDAFATDSLARGSRTPDALARGSRTPDALAASAFSPDAIARGSRTPDDFARGSRTPDALSPDAYAPDLYAPDDFARGSRTPDDFARGSRTPEAYGSAQTRSLIAISAFDGTASEGILLNTWNNTGDFYIRVRGRNGAFSLAKPFHLEVQLLTGTCSGVSPTLPPTSLSAANGDFETIILHDAARMEGSAAEKATLLAALDAFASRSEVDGVVIDVSADARVAAANAQADAYPACPYAKNLVAEAIKAIIAQYRSGSSPEYIVLIGNDEVIPFYRSPDTASLGPESDYVPPVFDDTASQASLRLDYVLGQDFYGASTEVSFKGYAVPVPDIAVGRLVETAAQVTGMLAAYDKTNGVIQPTSGLVTGYDFFDDAARAIEQQLQLGLGVEPKTLITPADISPLVRPPAGTAPEEVDPNQFPWNATQLRRELLENRYDLIFLGGHFSASSALAADYETRLTTGDLASLADDAILENALIFSIGCHSGYNIVDAHGIPGVTREPDWAEAFAQSGTTFIGGTAYQYGDTDFIEYSERIYLEFSRQLRLDTASGDVAIGPALVRAKQIYLANTPQLRDLHVKSLLASTVFGLPMMKVKLPAGGERFTPGTAASIVGATTPVPAGPDNVEAFGLSTADIALVDGSSTVINQSTVQLTDIDNPADTVEALYLSADNNMVVTNQLEPVLPLVARNVSVPGAVLRGVGFRGGSYVDRPNVIPLTGAPTTELRGVHIPFSSDIFFPAQPWSVNYFDLLAAGGATWLNATPAQFISSAPGSETNTLRQYDALNFRLYYSNNIETLANGNIPALVAPPAIVRVVGAPSGDQVDFEVTVVGNPDAGLSEVWVTYTVCPPDTPRSPCSGDWQSINLTQSQANTAIWQGTLALNGVPAENIRYLVQAANGVGLVSMVTNLGYYYIPGVDVDPQPASLALEAPASTSGPYGAEATFSAVLTDQSGQPIAGQPVNFGLGAQRGVAITDGSGRATATISLRSFPGSYEVTAVFNGTPEYQATSAPNGFEYTITRQDTVLCLEPPSSAGDNGCDSQPLAGLADGSTLAVATLTDALGQRLFERTVIFVISGGGQFSSVPVITDLLGRAPLQDVSLPAGDYTLEVYFNGDIPVGPNETISLNDERYKPAKATMALTVLNARPVANDDAYTFSGPLTISPPGVLQNDTDQDGDPLTASRVITAPISGTVTLRGDGGFSYTPTVKFTGADVFGYEVSDTAGLTATATVTLTPTACFLAEISPANAQIMWPPDKSLYEVTVSVSGTATVTVVSVFQDEPVGRTQDAFIIDNDTVQIRAERLGKGEDGRVYHIFFMADDGQGNVCSGSRRVGIVPHDQSQPVDQALIDAADGGPLYDSTVPGNIPPEVNDDFYITDEDTPLLVAASGVLSNDLDLDGDSLVVAAVNDNPADVGLQVTLASGALLTLNQDGSLAYDPAGRFDGLAAGQQMTDTFRYQAGDGEDVSSGTVVLTVTGLNDSPVANADGGAGYVTDEDTAFTTANVLSNDIDPDAGDSLSVFALDTGGTLGAVTDQGDGAFRYDPAGRFDALAAGQTMTDAFRYTLIDSLGATSVATVTITVTGLAEPPLANADAGSTDEETPLVIDVLSNDSDPEGTALAVDSLDLTGATGSVSLNGDGSITYDPAGRFDSLAVGEQAVDRFGYTLRNGNGDTASATVTITIDGVNDKPLAVDDQAATAENAPVIINVVGNDSDPDGSDVLSVTAIDAGSAVGAVTSNGDGTVTYDPNGQFDSLASGEQAVETFSYTIADGHGGTASATVIVTINGLDNLPPSAGDDQASTAENQAVVIAVLSNDSDPDGANLAVDSFDAGGALGLVTDNGDGTFTYDPNGQFNYLAAEDTATDRFTYTIIDAAGATATATVIVTINGVTTAPDAQDDAYTMNQGDTLGVNSPGVLGNDRAGDSGGLVVSAVNGSATAVGSEITLPASGARLTLRADGSFTFSPRSNFKGQDSFTYTINGDTATVIITVLKPNQ